MSDREVELVELKGSLQDAQPMDLLPAQITRQIISQVSTALVILMTKVLRLYRKKLGQDQFLPGCPVIVHRGSNHTR